MELNQSMFANYAREIEKHWKYKETIRKKLNFHSPQLAYRSNLINWLQEVAEKQNVSYRTLHLATHILDIFMDNHNITNERLGFVALVCLMLAAKFEEFDCKIPTISELNKYDGSRYSNRNFIRLEVMVLKCIDFELTQPTVAHFADYYTAFAVLPQDKEESELDEYSLLDTACNLIKNFLVICLKEVSFLVKRPSEVAAACMIATRHCLNLVPKWTNVLEFVTGYKEEELTPCFKLLLSLLHTEESWRNHSQSQSPDRGYISESY